MVEKLKGWCKNCREYSMEWVQEWAKDENGIARPVGGYYRCPRCGHTSSSLEFKP